MTLLWRGRKPDSRNVDHNKWGGLCHEERDPPKLNFFAKLNIRIIKNRIYCLGEQQTPPVLVETVPLLSDDKGRGETAREKKGSSEVRTGTLNGGSRTGEGRQLAFMEQRKADILCVQDTREKEASPGALEVDLNSSTMV